MDPVPPVVVAVILPLFPPLHNTAVVELTVILGELGAVIVWVEVAVQLFASVT